MFAGAAAGEGGDGVQKAGLLCHKTGLTRSEIAFASSPFYLYPLQERLKGSICVKHFSFFYLSFRSGKLFVYIEHVHFFL